VTRRDFREAADLQRSAATSRWSYSTRRHKGSLDLEESTQKWLVEGTHRRGVLSGDGGIDSGAGSNSPVVSVDKRFSGGVAVCSFGVEEWRRTQARACAGKRTDERSGTGLNRRVLGAVARGRERGTHGARGGTGPGSRGGSRRWPATWRGRGAGESVLVGRPNIHNVASELFKSFSNRIELI
jgi:hypothetical protein